VLAEVAGVVRVGGKDERRRGKRPVFVQPVDRQDRPAGREREHLVPPGQELLVGTGDYVEAGDALTDGQPLPHDLLRICGVDAVQDYLLREVQNVYRGQRVAIDDKHVEVIIAQMLRKVRVRSAGDTDLLPGGLVDKFAFREVNSRLRHCVRVKDPGASRFEAGAVVSRNSLADEEARLEKEGRPGPTVVAPRPATCTPVLLGVAQAALQSDSFISAASFQETTKVLTEAALAGKVDYLVGLKENVILGHLVPAGTGFGPYQEAEVRPAAAPAPRVGAADGAPAVLQGIGAVRGKPANLITRSSFFACAML
jgi:DNA-directed RNA polymerase subunit beta'